MRELNLEQARALVLAAQGFAAPRPAKPTVAHMRHMIHRLNLLQVDSVNVLVRAHYMPLFSRLGPYPREALDRLSDQPKRALFEYWGHEASLLPLELYPYLRWRMESPNQRWAAWAE